MEKFDILTFITYSAELFPVEYQHNLLRTKPQINFNLKTIALNDMIDWTLTETPQSNFHE